MKKQGIIIAIAVLLLLSVLFAVGCDSVSHNVKELRITDFRRQDSYRLPIKAPAAEMIPYSPKRFKSKASLTQLESMIGNDNTLVVQNMGTYLLVQSVSGTPMGYCMIYPQRYNEFNYVLCDMSCDIKVNERTLTVAAPLHLIPRLMSDRKIGEGIAYDCTATLDELADFYRFYGYDVTPLPDCLILKDTIGKSLNGQNTLDDMVTYCELLYGNGTVTFTQCNQPAE